MKEDEYKTKVTLTEKELDLLCRYMRFAHMSNAYPEDGISMHIHDDDLPTSRVLLSKLDNELGIMRS